MIRSLESPRRREGSGVLKEEERTNVLFFFSTVLSLSHIRFFFFFKPRIAAAAKLLQSCPTLSYPTEGSPPGSMVPGILQARILEWVAISFSNA